MVSQTSPSFSTEDLIILPVKSFFAHRVLWLTIPLAIKFSVLSISTSNTSALPSAVILTILSVVKSEVPCIV